MARCRFTVEGVLVLQRLSDKFDRLFRRAFIAGNHGHPNVWTSQYQLVDARWLASAQSQQAFQ
ncbi:hypothetical protein SAM40697_3334 [Streptomyces ambofaciens]|uniref:Transposase n=1 Tax=Streptomyces ambofaciens TaxID=1889 RepID=A0ABM6B0Q2_STRAM|nr:hypothetical protein SAM40697_3334 [Streptomyces ambofaciens]